VQDGKLTKPGEATITRNDTDAIPEVDVTMEMLRNSPANPETWLLYGGGLRNQRHMQGSAITPENVSELSLEWQTNVGVTPGEYQGTPLIVPGDPPIMYQTNGPDHLRAMNPRTGDVLWHYDYDSLAEVGDPSANRGVTILGDTVYFTTLDMGIIALDRYTGEEKWFFNQAKTYRDEQVENPDSEIHEELNFTRNVGYSSGIPPIPYDGNLLKGSFGGEWGVTGWIDAVSTDGEHQWRFDTTPHDQWVGDAWRHGSTTVWQPPAVDAESGTAVFPMGNPGPDFDATVRPGWNQYSTGKLALDASSGEYRWHFQESPHDWWDYDSPSPPFIFDAEVNGEERTLASWPGKSGWLFTFDLETGEMVERSQEYVQHINMWALPKHEDMEGTPWNAPNLLGGTNPQPPAYDPETRTAVIMGQNIPWKISWTDAEYEAQKLYWGLHGFEFANNVEDPPDEWNGDPGVIAGIDPVSGEVKWQNWREIPPWGGAMTTDTGLTFTGASEGQVLALDTETGEELWSADLGVGVGGDPVSWIDPAEGTQYLAIQGGGEGPLGGYGEQGDVLAVYSMEVDTGATETATPTETAEPTPTETAEPTPTETAEPTPTEAEAGGGTTETTSGSGPGLGVLSALAGIGGAAAGYAFGGESDEDEEE
jgi:alcohol dehydrogenase (cytochrome c)